MTMNNLSKWGHTNSFLKVNGREFQSLVADTLKVLPPSDSQLHLGQTRFKALYRPLSDLNRRIVNRGLNLLSATPFYPLISYPWNNKFKVALSSFWVTTPLNFVKLLYHHKESDRKSIVIAELEKDQSFKWDKFCPNRSYHSNGMTSYPIWHKT